jgi:hypothetical protein
LDSSTARLAVIAATTLAVLEFDEVIGQNQAQFAPEGHRLTQIKYGAKNALFPVAHNVNII